MELLRRIVARVLMVLALGAALPACADDTPTYRYRLTVEVDTPAGLRSGSSVIEVDTRLVRPGSNPASYAVEHRVRGEAVAVDLPGGRTLFALLRSPDDTDWASRVMVDLTPQQPGETPLESFVARYAAAASVAGERVLPPVWPRRQNWPARSAWPMLVTFGDLAEPTSVALVDPDDLAASFGEGVALRRITVQITDDPVTTGIEERLGWLEGQDSGMLDGRTNNTIRAENRLANDLSRMDFSRGIFR